MNGREFALDVFRKDEDYLRLSNILVLTGSKHDDTSCKLFQSTIAKITSHSFDLLMNALDGVEVTVVAETPYRKFLEAQKTYLRETGWHEYTGGSPSAPVKEIMNRTGGEPQIGDWVLPDSNYGFCDIDFALTCQIEKDQRK
jgi:hypothetical protein